MSSIVSFTGRITFAAVAVLIGWIGDRFGIVPALAETILISALSIPFYVRLFGKHSRAA